jgi:hypothetical protein
MVVQRLAELNKKYEGIRGAYYLGVLPNPLAEHLSMNENSLPVDTASTARDLGYVSKTQGSSKHPDRAEPRRLDNLNREPEAPFQQAFQEESPRQGLYTADTVYSKSESSNLHDKGYVIDIAAALYESIDWLNLDIPTLKRVSELLPDLLRTFAIKVGYSADTQIQRDIAYFVHKYRS